MTEQHKMLMDDFSDEEWKNLIASIAAGKCVVCIGPQVLASSPHKPFESELASFLSDQAHNLGIRVYDNGWYHPTGTRKGITTISHELKKFYARMETYGADILAHLAGIPFHLYLNLNPDYSLKKAFKKYDDPVFRTYSYNGADEVNEKPSRDNPLVYNLLGEMDNMNSMVLTYDHFYDYLKSILATNSISKIVSTCIHEADYFLFIGMPFHQWYMHLLLRILQQRTQKDDENTLRTAIPRPSHTVDHFMDQYTIRFVNEDILSFVKKLMDKCADEGHIRPEKPQEKTTSDFSSLVQSLLFQCKFAELHSLFMEKLKQTGPPARQYIIEFNNLNGEFNRINKQFQETKNSQEHLEKLIELQGKYIKAIDNLALPNSPFTV